MGILFIMTVYSIVVRPYRDIYTNLILIVGLFGFTVQMLEMDLKMSGTKTTFFVDKYFFYLQIGQFGFAIFFLFIMLIVILMTKGYRWPVNDKTLQEYTTGQT